MLKVGVVGRRAADRLGRDQ